MLINVKENFFDGFLMHLNQRNLEKAGDFYVEESSKYPQPRFQLSETSRNCCHFTV